MKMTDSQLIPVARLQNKEQYVSLIWNDVPAVTWGGGEEYSGSLPCKMTLIRLMVAPTWECVSAVRVIHVIWESKLTVHFVVLA